MTLVLLWLSAWLSYGLASDRSRGLVGTWKLITIRGAGPGSNLQDTPSGMLVYSDNGHMIVLMNFGTPGADKSSGGYYGTYSVDDVRQTITHHLQGTTNVNSPVNRIGAEKARRFVLEGTRLILIPAEVANGERTLVWERVTSR